MSTGHNRGQATLEQVRIAIGSDVADESPSRSGNGRTAHNLLSGRRNDAQRPHTGKPSQRCAGMAQLGDRVPGVDGLLSGRRGRARLFAANKHTPMAIISIGAPETLQRCLPRLQELFAEPAVTLERLAEVKHDGDLLEPPPRVVQSADRDREVWQAIQVYTRRAAKVTGACYTPS